jgi:hypothetical protein
MSSAGKEMEGSFWARARSVERKQVRIAIDRVRKRNLLPAGLGEIDIVFTPLRSRAFKHIFAVSALSIA